MKNNHYHHYIVMFFIMIISGLLSTMNIWVDKVSDIRFSMNDIYMTLLMTGWMFLFMALYYKEKIIFIIGLFLVIFNIICIRTQFLVSENQYKLGMIPHHSMAIHMSKKLLNKKRENNGNNENMISFLENIINTQEKEILFMKHFC